MGPPEVEAFPTRLAAEANVAASTQNQAFHAILFLYGEVLDISLEGESINALRARKKNLPVVLIHKSLKAVNNRINSHGLEGSQAIMRNVVDIICKSLFLLSLLTPVFCVRLWKA